MSPLRIAIVTYNWPPRNAIGTHRPYAWARYWSEAGAVVTVLTSVKQVFDEPLDMPLPYLDGVGVVSISYGGVRSGLINRLLKFQRARNLAKKVKSWLARSVGTNRDPRLAWRAAARDTAIRLATECDVVVSTYGPSASHLIASDMKKANPSLHWVADYRDLWSQKHLGEVTERSRNESRETELAAVGRYADSLTAVSNDMVQQLGDLTSKPVRMFPNGFDIDEDLVRKRLREPIRQPIGTLRIVYTGMIYKGHRDPVPLLDALASLAAKGKLAPESVTVDFYGARVDVARELSQNPKYAPFIRVMGHVSRQQALDAQRNAWLLLLLESSETEARGVLTGKIFEYIAAGRPILCVGSRPDFEIGRVLSQTGTGTVFAKNEQVRLEGAISETLSGRGLYDSYRPNFQQVLRFSRKRISFEFLEMLEGTSTKNLQI
ncbi:hypothetical protein [Notoacmeibacter sp. MSK16QG-6]|uniref:hypothetical protein n=1 Tax=Notoacmeibacter sp. MSK16QG-6 TaxID=2957982 RepID=UPI0020A078B3|nr:hypothetical protein [Notoacmeibacter sp. MSK16QG-6]MCP1198059.1 hypothetical protein [Notoacmeibacter sp. MSK16QG-6]